MIRLIQILVVSLASLVSLGAAEPSLDLSLLENSFQAQKKIRSISAEFIQTRALKTLKSPIAIKGRFWFEAPDLFRWELGEPAKSIVIGSHKGVSIIQPAKKRVEKMDFTNPAQAQGAPEFLRMMNMLSSRSVENLQNEMNILSLKNTGSNCRLEMLPKDPQMAKGLTSLVLDFDQSTGYWIAFELVTKEGSSMRTEFRNVQLNAKLDARTFEYDTTGYHIDEAGR